MHPGDAADVVDDALAALVARAESAESERAWLRTRLSVLADVTGGEGQVPVAEVASAAARVLEASAADRPLVLTIEDLHWSEPALRDVLSAIVDDADAPLVVLCTARPELFDTDAAWGGGRANSTTIRLAPLSDEETSALVEALLSTAIRTESERERVLRNIGGNPLFAIEYVRMLDGHARGGRGRHAGLGAGGDRRPVGFGRAADPRGAAGRRRRGGAVLARRARDGGGRRGRARGARRARPAEA